MFRDDWLHREIQKLADAIAKVMDARTGPTEQQDLAIDQAYDAILGPHRDFLGMVDEATLAGLLADEERVRALIELTALDAARKPDPRDSERLRARGRRLLATLRQTPESERRRLADSLDSPQGQS